MHELWFPRSGSFYNPEEEVIKTLWHEQKNCHFAKQTDTFMYEMYTYKCIQS